MIRIKILFLGFLTFSFMITRCSAQTNDPGSKNQQKFHLLVLAPAHFHAALVQKFMYAQVSSTVHVYTPPADSLDIKSYMGLINQYNNRPVDPTHWEEKIYTGHDYLEKMLQERPSHKMIVVIAGNNKLKTNYITQSIDAGMNVLADKPMVITSMGFQQLQKDFIEAKKNKVQLYDIMTERYAITQILQKMLMHMPGIFGNLRKGSINDPTIVFENLHHFYKEVSGQPLIRPTWYFDVNQQGEGIVDVTTHLIDLIQWECFPETIFNYRKDIRILSARHWPTRLTINQFSRITEVDTFPDFLRDSVKGGLLNVYANGELNYTVKGIHTRVLSAWKYIAPKGENDTYHSEIRGTKATLSIWQDKAQGYKSTLYIRPVEKGDTQWNVAMRSALEQIDQKYPGVRVKNVGDSLQVIIPPQYDVSDEARFSDVVKKYLEYLKEGHIPAWEVSFMLTKYYIATSALRLAVKGAD